MTAEDMVTEKTIECAAQKHPPDILQLFEFLSFNNKIMFKSQQIDDPELQRNEKIQIAKEIFERNRQTFLQRFGVYFEEQHLSAFERHLAIVKECSTQLESLDEMQDILFNLKSRLQTRNRDIKNRRFSAMQNLIKEGEYFSELEMMKRAPELYQELIGQYLSKEEIEKRDSYDVKNTTFSGIFMHQLEQQQKDEILQNAESKSLNENLQEIEDTNHIVQAENKPPIKQDFEIENDSEDDELEKSRLTDVDTNSYEDTFDVPKLCQMQWGNFDNENIAQRQRESAKSNVKITNMFITAGERTLLREEFVGIMQQSFLAGKDENFDYSVVDDDTRLDDLTQINQDKEDAYFATSDEEDDTILTTLEPKTVVADLESEDELDIYMRHLNQHHSLKN